MTPALLKHIYVIFPFIARERISYRTANIKWILTCEYGKICKNVPFFRICGLITEFQIPVYEMLFNSLKFALFFIVVFAVYWLVPNRYRWVVLLTASCFFYMSWSAVYILLLLLLTAVSYFAAILIEEKHTKSAVSLSIAAVLIPLLVFKYLGFLSETLSGVLSAFSINLHPLTLKLLMPIGISFYTFQIIGYLADVYRGDIKAERHFGYYALFVSFFPQIISGPIGRAGSLIPQYREEKLFDSSKAFYAVKLMVWGFFKKLVVADNLAVFADVVFADVTSYSGFSLVLASLFYTVQIYCDFSGYTDIARGVAGLLGIDLPLNFNVPYLATSLKEFWARWHMSLSTWLRDYIYIPLGGSRCSKTRSCLNIVITFLISGLWHGADWSFVLWGAMHGLIQAFEKLAGINPYRGSGKLKRFARAVPVFIFVSLAWIFFRADSVSDAFYVISHLFTGISSPGAYISGGISAVAGLRKIRLLIIIFLYILPVAVFDTLSLRGDVIEKLSSVSKPVRYAVYFAVLLLTTLFASASGVSFVYFQF